jgi:DNA-binding NarL/FixJ family response regulator
MWHLRERRHPVEVVVNYIVTYAPVPAIEAELLTNRQREVFDLIVAGLSNKEIARQLCLAEGTVKIHVANLFDKLGVRHRSAVALAGFKFRLRPSRPAA